MDRTRAMGCSTYLVTLGDNTWLRRSRFENVRRPLPAYMLVSLRIRSNRPTSRQL